MKNVRSSGRIALIFLSSALGVSEWLASRPSRFITGERTPFTHWIGVLLNPRFSQDAVRV
jgi:hypothetical protein